MTVGAIRARLEKQQWVLELPKVYRIAGSFRDWRQALQVAFLWGGAGTIVSHRAAAALWGLQGFAEAVEISTARNARRLGFDVIVHQAEVASRDVTRIDGLPVTTVARTLFDLCAVESPSRIQSALDECLRRKLVRLDDLARLAPRMGGQGRWRVGVLHDLIERYLGGEAPTESELEAQVYELLIDAGLPLPEKQKAVIVGGKLRRLDFCYPAQRVVLEVDGYAYHSSPEQFESDAARRSSLAIRGFCVIHVTSKSFNANPELLITRTTEALRRRAA